MLFTPPRFAEALLRCVLTAEDSEVISGDLEETARMSIARARGAAQLAAGIGAR